MLSLPIHSISQLSNLEPAAGPPVAGEDVKKIVNLKQQKKKRRKRSPKAKAEKAAKKTQAPKTPQPSQAKLSAYHKAVKAR